jgi:hypothetical protein
MKKYLLILFLIIAVGFIPGMLCAQQSSQERSGAGMYAAQSDTSNSEMNKSDMSKGDVSKSDSTAAKKGNQDWEARHKEFQREITAMDQKLDKKIAAMNAAKGDRKIAAMSDVINEMAAQRKELQHMARTAHEERMAHRSRASSDTGPMMKGSEGMSKDNMQGMHQDMGAPKEDPASSD